jgi:hypothetical protein
MPDSFLTRSSDKGFAFGTSPDDPEDANRGPQGLDGEVSEPRSGRDLARLGLLIHLSAEVPMSGLNADSRARMRSPGSRSRIGSIGGPVDDHG